MKNTSAEVRIPAGVTILAAGTFVTGTSEFMPAGILPDIAAEYRVSVPDAGLLISSFAMGMIIGALGSLVISRWIPRITMLLTALALLGIGHVIGAFTSDYLIFLFSRAVIAIAAGAFVTAATEFAVAITPVAGRASAVARLLSGMVAANVAGVPISAFISNQLGWRAVFIGMFVLSVLTASALYLTTDELDRDGGKQAQAGIATAIWKGDLILAYIMIIVYEIAVVSLLTFVKPFLIECAEFDASEIPAALAAFGVAGFVGLRISGRYADRWPWRILGVSLFCLGLSAFGLRFIGHQNIAITGIGLIAFGMSAFAAAPPLNLRSFTLSNGSSVLASAGNITAFNIGNLCGPLIAGWSIHIWSPTAIPLVSSLAAFLALGLMFISKSACGR
ncbi:MFS transporter [Mycobacteroides abscessus]|uniref:MFS transporter n=1 Tax=Mycobacteroides abscessus TaxID=36809 RepID=UPI0012FFD43D|nr:MFS transporter [Mycobacteroides abscessus]